MKRRNRPVVEDDDYAGFTGRVIRAQGRRIAAGDVEGLTELLALEDELARAVFTAVTGLRGCGYSWAEIAARTGTTRQAAHQRWGTASTARAVRGDRPRSLPRGRAAAGRCREDPGRVGRGR